VEGGGLDTQELGRRCLVAVGLADGSGEVGLFQSAGGWLSFFSRNL